MEIASPHLDFVDLHIHSTASDGSLSPLEIIRRAKELGLRAIAITDHDTIEGSAEALAQPQSPSLEILSGIEISADVSLGTMHILGYLIALDDPFLTQTLKTVQEARADRNVRIIKKLQDMGVEITHEDVTVVSGGGQVGRPHIAQVLVKKGVVRSFGEAFLKYLKKWGPAYVPRYRLQPAEAIQMILRTGGVPVLAHPFTLDAKDEPQLESILAGLKQAGLMGMEVYYPEHRPERTALFERLARRQGLLMTGGTDFHGAAKPEVEIGIGRGDLRISYGLVERLKEAAAQNRLKKPAVDGD
ncbi:MAG: PHP domain-containing protein [Thermodesulfobacteriota bacterium]|nr:PHP domain-containing protein [Thermodesulfobacteriota bacterium]